MWFRSWMVQSSPACGSRSDAGPQHPTMGPSTDEVMAGVLSGEEVGGGGHQVTWKGLFLLLFLPGHCFPAAMGRAALPRQALLPWSSRLCTETSAPLSLVAGPVSQLLCAGSFRNSPGEPRVGARMMRDSAGNGLVSTLTVGVACSGTGGAAPRSASSN